jgi:hypothetical protein
MRHSISAGYSFGLLAFGLLAATTSSFAATVSVSCPAQSINAAIENFFSPSGSPPRSEKLTIVVSGTCTENVQIQPYREVTLLGGGTAVLQPDLAEKPVLHVQGRGFIRGFKIRSSKPTGFPAGLIQAGPYGYLEINSSTVTSTTAQVLVQGYLLSQLLIVNSVVSGGTERAVQVSENSHAFVISADGGRTTIRNGANDSIGCYQAELTVWAFDTSSPLTIGPSYNDGINSTNCTGVIRGAQLLGAENNAIYGGVGDSFEIRRTKITGNPGAAVRLNAGSMRIVATTIGNNGSGLHAQSGATIRFEDFEGASTIFQSADRYNCYQGGRIYAEPGDITGAVSTNCLTVGGPVTH